MTAGTAPTTHIVFGVTFNLHGTLVPISTDDIANAKANGVELKLPSKVELGSLDDFAAWFKTQFGIDIPPASALPPPLDKVVGKLTSMDVWVEEAYVKIPGTSSADQNTYFTLVMSGEWPSGQGIPLIPSVLTIDGVVIGASNVPPKPTPTPPSP